MIPRAALIALTAVSIAPPVAAPLAAPLGAETPRDALTAAAFQTRDKAAALAQIAGAEATATAVLRRAPNDGEALMARAMAVSYRAKLNQSRGDALAAKAQFEALVARNAQDPEAQAALGGWHLEAINGLGGFMARTVLGARKNIGLAAIDRAVALGDGRALFAGLAGLLRLSLDPGDAQGRKLIDAAVRGATPTAVDRMMQRRAVTMQNAVKAGDAKTIQALAHRLLPLGQIGK